MPPYSLYPCLLVFYIGYLFASVHRDCGGTVDTAREHSGHIQYSWPPPESDAGRRAVQCTWLLRARSDQALRLAAVSVAGGSRLCVAFERSAARRRCVSGDWNLLSGTGSAVLSWTSNETAWGAQSLQLFFTYRNDTRNSPEDVNEFWTASAHVNFTTHTGTSSLEMPGIPRAMARSGFSPSKVPGLRQKGKIKHTKRFKRQDASHGTIVSAFQSSPTAPSLWLSLSTSAVSDKEMAPLPQETRDNNPDVSVNALGVSNLTTTLGSVAEGLVRAKDVARLHQVESEVQDITSEPELLFVLESSRNSSTDTTGADQLTQNLDPSIHGQFRVLAPRHRVLLPLPSAPAESDTPSSRLYSSVIAGSVQKTLPSPNLEEFGPNTGRSTYAASTPDHLLREHQDVGVGTAHFGTTSLPSEDVPPEAGAHNPSMSEFLYTHLNHNHSPVHHLTTVLADNPSINIYVQSNHKHSSQNDGDPTVMELPSVSPSIPSNTPEVLHELNGSTNSENPLVRGSTSVSSGELPLKSNSEETTYPGSELDHMITGDIYQSTKRLQTNAGAVDFPEFSTLKTGGISEAEILKTSIPGVYGVDVTTLPDGTEKLNNFTSEDTDNFMQRTRSAVPHSETLSNTPYENLESTRTHLTSFMDSETTSSTSAEQELADGGTTDLPFSMSHSTTLRPNSVSPPYTEIQTQLPEIGSSTLLDNYNPMSTSGTYTSELSSLSESITKSAYDVDSSTSTVPPFTSGGSAFADYTLHTTAGRHVDPTTPEEKFRTSPQSTPEHHLEITSISSLASSSPMLNPWKVAPGTTQEGTYTSSEGHSETEDTHSGHGSVVYHHTLHPTPVHTFTVNTDAEGTPLSVTAVPSSGTLPISPSQEMSPHRDFTSPSPDSTLVTPKVHQKFFTTVQGGTDKSKPEACPHCTSIAVPTLSPTVATAVVSTGYGSVGATQQQATVARHVTYLPGVTSVAPTTASDSATTGRGVSAASTQTPMGRIQTSSRSSTKPVHSRVFVVEDQPVIIKERCQYSKYFWSWKYQETVQLLLQIVLATEGQGSGDAAHLDSLTEEAVAKVESFLRRAPGFRDLRVSWTSGGTVVQSIATFHTAGALSWLGVPGALLQVTGLRDAVRQGLYVNRAKVENITVGGPQSELCSWLFRCPSGFQCVTSNTGNTTCTSLCHTHYCKNDGICTHHHGQPPMCQCPVGEDFWFMGRQCDSHMTRQKLVGLCLGILLAAALLMGAVSFLVIRHFKAMLVQAKVDQTRSSYRRFNHFDELSGRFWLRSWPGSADSLDNPAFSHSDELLHLRALDRTCCYHDDTLSVVSTFHGSGTHLNTIYAHGSQYNWDLSDVSVNEFMADSGKASDLSVCSWPIEPIQWTPFPLLQQLGAQRPVRTSRPRSYCEGMELVDLEKTWTA